jgi:hypothetical protein
VPWSRRKRLLSYVVPLLVLVQRQDNRAARCGPVCNFLRVNVGVGYVVATLPP